MATLSQAELAKAEDGLDVLRLELAARRRGEEGDARLDFVLDALLDALDELRR